MTSVQAKLTRLSPRLAGELLQRNTHNRPATAARVTQYATDMRNGAWVLNGEAIKIAQDGRVLDGQHRLMAVLEADVTIETLVITGLDLQAQETMDQGQPRSFGDTLKLRGEKNYTVLAAATAIVCVYERDGVPHRESGAARPSIPQLSRTLERNPDLRESVELALGLIRPWLPVSQIAALHYLFAIADTDNARAFVTRLATGEQLSAADPIYVLRERLISEHANPETSLNTKVKLAFLVRTWNAFMRGETIRRLVFQPGGANPDRFPQIHGLAGRTQTGAGELAEAA